MFLLTRALVRALKAPPIAPSALSDFRAVGRGGASRRLWQGLGAGLRGGAIAPLLLLLFKTLTPLVKEDAI